jgi:hypothetical protein
VKNIAIGSGRAPEVVEQQDVIDQMVPNYAYSQDEVCALLPDSPRTAVRDTLHKLVERGIVWRATARTPIKFILLEGERLQEAIEQKAERGRTPDWMTRNLTGYDAAHRNFRELCEATRKN